jgi:subtilisin
MVNKLHTKKIAYFLVFSIVLGFSGVAHGASEDTRYLIKSNSGFWKKSFGVRHQFDGGFTSDLTDLQLRVAKVFGIEVEPVGKFYILADTVASEGSGSEVLDTISQGKPDESIGGKPTPGPIASIRPAPTDQVPWGVRAIYNDDLIETTSGGVGVNVAVLDTGVLMTHPDLKDRIAQCKDFTSAKTPMIDGKCEDKNGHGTHVAGIIAADGGADGLGIYGVAPEANIFAYRVCGNNGSCWADDIAGAITAAANQGANIINMSLGSDVESTMIKSAINYAVSKNVLVVAAAGNDGPDIGSIDYPGANPNVIAVGAFDVSLEMADWSSRGVNSNTEKGVIEEGDVEFAAPGVIIESTWKDGGYLILSGTSMATPHISGLAAQIWNKSAEDPDSDTRALLKSFVKEILPAGEDDASGYGFPQLK